MISDSSVTDFVKKFLGSKGISSKKITFQKLAGDGSIRLFQRFIPEGCDTSFIIMENTPENVLLEKENLSYLKIGNHLYKKGLAVPEIFDFDLKKGLFILEDLGDINLQKAVSLLNDPIKLYEQILEFLFKLQVEGASGFDPEYCYQTKRYDRYVMRRYESEYFRDSFLINYLGINKDLTGLEMTFDFLASKASYPKSNFFLHRDFQSRNIMICNGKIKILDWQGARLGPLAYDLASLVIDPYTDLSDITKKNIYESYFLLLKESRSVELSSFEESFPYLAIQRNLQILGAFAYLSKIRKKPYFEAFIPTALYSLNSLLVESGDSQLLPLREILNEIIISIKEENDG